MLSLNIYKSKIGNSIFCLDPWGRLTPPSPFTRTCFKVLKMALLVIVKYWTGAAICNMTRLSFYKLPSLENFENYAKEIFV